MTLKGTRVFVIGLAVAFALQSIQALAFGGDWTGLLGVGTGTELASFIENDLGPVYEWADVGHDGQISYAIARDLSGQIVPPLLDHPGYRYRRILYPAASGLGGLLPPMPTLVGLIVLAAVGLAMSSVGVMIMARRLGLTRWTWLVVALLPGTWLSAQLLTTDSLALGLSLLGLAWWLDEKRVAGGVLLALAPLSKETYVLVGLVLAVWELGSNRRRAAQLGLIVL
ncbi:MAG: hypothetical protein ACRDWH_11025, partial [Acidimicrobiia bacterium]